MHLTIEQINILIYPSLYLRLTFMWRMGKYEKIVSETT
jgi:hypothetical protein